MNSKFRRILILFSLIAAVACDIPVGGPDINVTKPRCEEPTTFWNGWVCICPLETPLFDEEENTCSDCTHGRIWNSIYEECKCPTEDQDFNDETNLCECSGGRTFNATSVTCDCTFGREWDSFNEECKCPNDDMTWNYELNICECRNGKVWNPASKDCECSGGRMWDDVDDACVCENGKTFNEDTDECLCQDGKVWIADEFDCACPTNFQWNGTACETKDRSCEIGKKWDGFECIPYCQKYEELVEESCVSRCHRNEIWDGEKRRCIQDCGEDEIFDDYFNKCHVKCKENQIWSDDMEACVFECPAKQHLHNGECVCDEGLKLNGETCEEIKELPTCSEGYDLVNGTKCVQSVGIECPPGYENVDNHCEKKQVTLINCLPGFSYNEIVNKCVSTVDPFCPPGSNLENNSCVESVTIKPTCPEGYVFQVNKCVRIQEPNCPEGYEKREGKCFKKVVCTETQQMKDGICIEIKCPEGYSLNNRVCELPKNDNCPEGYILENGRCQRKVDHQCPGGFTLVGDVCRRNVDDKCPEGFTLDGGQCKRNIDDKCPNGFTLENGTCRPTVEGKCPDGFELKDNMCKRETIEDCPSGYAFIGGTCRRVLDPSCPDGFILTNGTCKPAVNANCPTGYVLVNNVCTRETVHDCPIDYVLDGGVCKPKVVENPTCPEGYILYRRDCIKDCPERFHIENGKCVSDESEPLTKLCKDDEIVINDKCYKVICPDGFVILDNKCIEVSCPEGYVWFEGSCKTAEESGSGAVFEINNYIYNHVTRNLSDTPAIPIQNTNVVNVYVDGNSACAGENCVSESEYEDGTDSNIEEPEIDIDEGTFTPPALTHTTPLPIITTRLPILSTTTLGPRQNCCRIITPRVCKKYDDKWLCYNKNFQDCSEFCVKPVVYLKPPRVIYKPPVLIVPPNPPLESCKSENCEEPKIDCSGCFQYQKETCSSYCYDYHCVNRDCTYFPQDEYCRKYPFSVGCTYQFGCIGDWCNGSAVGINPNEKLEKPCSN